MASRGLTDKYDHIILAGAVLGALTDKFPAWNQTFWDHVRVARDLHKIHKVLVLDHRDCGAYKIILGEDFAKAPAKETTIRTTQLKQWGKCGDSGDTVCQWCLDMQRAGQPAE